MERIARVTGKDPLDVKMLNMNPMDKEMLTPMIEELKKTSDYEQRRAHIDKFNKVTAQINNILFIMITE